MMIFQKGNMYLLASEIHSFFIRNLDQHLALKAF